MGSEGGGTNLMGDALVHVIAPGLLVQRVVRTQDGEAEGLGQSLLRFARFYV